MDGKIKWPKEKEKNWKFQRRVTLPEGLNKVVAPPTPSSGRFGNLDPRAAVFGFDLSVSASTCIRRTRIRLGSTRIPFKSDGVSWQSIERYFLIEADDFYVPITFTAAISFAAVAETGFAGFRGLVFTVSSSLTATTPTTTTTTTTTTET